MSINLHDLFDVCPHCSEKIKKGAKICRHCQISVGGWRRYFLQPLKLFLELSALIASLVAIGSFSLTQQQLELQRIANEKTQKQIEQTQRQIEQSDTNSAILRSEAAEWQRSNMLVQARMEREDKTYREANRPWIKLGRMDCNFKGNEHLVYLNIENSGLRNADNICVSLELLDTTRWLEASLPPDSISVLATGQARVQSYAIPAIPIIVVKVVAKWTWTAFSLTESAEKFYIIQADSTRTMGCDAKVFMDNDGHALWERHKSRSRL